MNEKTLRVLEYGKIKERLSQKAHSSLGKEKIKNLFPSVEKSVVKQAMEETTEVVEVLLKQGHFPTGPIYDLVSQIKRSKIGGTLSAENLLDVADTARTARRIKSFIKSNQTEERQLPILGNYAEGLTPLKKLEEAVSRSIEDDGTISDNASLTLKKIRREKENKKTSIRKRLEAILRSAQNQKYIQDPLVTIRQDRFVIPVKSEHKNKIRGLVHDQSASGSTSYIEPMAVVEMNNELKQLDSEEKKEIERILFELTTYVSESANALSVNQEILTSVDFALAKGQLALDMKGSAPKFNDKGYVRIRNGRHPLLDSQKVVPANIWLGKDFTTLLITGPNTGGKTVSLKTLGLFSLMAQSGLYIPADYGSEMAIFEGIYADIGDEQSIEQSLSTFSSHMTNIVEILKEVPNNALVLFDELGAGTDPAEGAALAMAILTMLQERSIRTVATTHYSELKQFALVREGMENASVEFDVSTLSPTYRLLIGIPGKSNAFEISRRLGLSEKVIRLSESFLDKDDVELETVLSSLEKNRKIVEKERDEAIRLRLEVENLKRRLLEKQIRFDSQKDRALEASKKEAREILKQAKEDADEIIKNLRSLSSSHKQDNQYIESMRKKIRDDIKELEKKDERVPQPRKKAPQNLKLGQSVRIFGVSQPGSVLTLPDANGNLTVQVGIMKMKTSLSDIEMVEDKNQNTKWISKKKEKGSHRSVPHISMEMDVRGKTIEEAIYEIDKYLDDACLANLEKVHIIHGKGTGALRKGLMDFFKSHQQVKRVSQAPLNQGGAGVSVVDLK